MVNKKSGDTKVISVRISDKIFQVIEREAKRLKMARGTVAGIFLTLAVGEKSRLEIGEGDDVSDKD